MSKVFAIFLLLFSAICYGEDLIVVASISGSSLSDYVDPNAESCIEGAECIQMSYWRKYTANEITVISGHYNNSSIEYLMASHTNWYNEESLIPLRVILILEESGIKNPKYKVVEWDLLTSIGCLSRPIKGQKIFAHGKEEGMEYCYELERPHHAN